MLQLQKPVCPEPVPCSMRSHCDEKPTHRYKEQPLLTATTEAAQSNEDPMQQRKMNLASTLQTRSCCPLQFTNEDSEVLSVCYLLEHPNHGGSSCCKAQVLEHPQLLGLQQLWHMGSVALVVQGLNCPAACGIFSNQGSNPYPLHWQ
ncbi:hypothetical protein MJT46_004169, partial [Ovis ammon polii x Ovis aries]